MPITKAHELSDRASSIQLPHQVHIVANAEHGYDLNTTIDSSGETVFSHMLTFLYQHVVLSEDANLVTPTLGIASLALLAIFLIYIQLIRRQSSDQLNWQSCQTLSSNSALAAIAVKSGENQDALTLQEQLLIGVIADGMGEEPHGDVASKLAVDAWIDYLSLYK